MRLVVDTHVLLWLMTGDRVEPRALKILAEPQSQVFVSVASLLKIAIKQGRGRGLNPALGDRSPARLLREGAVDEVGPQVLAAARQFAVVG